MKRVDAFFETQPPLSADLQWMLQSRQASDAALCRALLDEYAARLYGLGQALAGGQSGAEEFAIRALLRSLLQRDHYRSSVSITAWVYRQALQANRVSWRTLGLVKHLHAVHGLSLLEIATILGQSLPYIQAEIEKPLIDEVSTRKTLEPLPEEKLGEWRTYLLEKLIEERWSFRRRMRIYEFILLGFILLAVFLLGRFFTPSSSEQFPTPAQTRLPVARFFQYAVRSGDTLELLAEKLGVSAEQIAETNALSLDAALTPGQRLMLPSGFARGRLATPAPLAAFPTPIPLGDAPSVEAIVQRAQDSLQQWQTLWADVEIIHYGPPGYVGLPQSITRKQLWVRMPGHARVIYGPRFQNPEGSYVIAAGYAYARDFAAGQVYEDLPGELLIDYDLKRLFLAQMSELQAGEFALAGRAEVAGRPAWVLDWKRPDGGRVYRFWVDALYGMILLRREYGGTGFDVALEDVRVTSVAFGEPFSPQIFDPFTFLGDHFAADSSGALETTLLPWSPPIWAGATGHEPLARNLPPPGYDPAASRLTFEYSNVEFGVHLFAGEYYLGMIPQEKPSTILSCERSANGRILVFGDLAGGKISLYWLSLDAPENLHPIFIHSNGLVTNDFAISPDSRRLAFFSCPTAPNECGVYLLDLETGLSRQLASALVAHYFRWKPDGSQLAWLNAADATHNWQYQVVDMESGNVIYQGGFDWLRIAPAPGSPTDEWGVPFQGRRGGLDGCIEPGQFTPALDDVPGG